MVGDSSARKMIDERYCVPGYNPCLFARREENPTGTRMRPWVMYRGSIVRTERLQYQLIGYLYFSVFVSVMAFGCANLDDGDGSSGSGDDDGTRSRGDDCIGGETVNECGGCGPLEQTLGAVCDPGYGLEPQPGVCVHGFWACSARRDGTLACELAEPADEVCDGVDNDCDGFVDEPFDLYIDPANCGECGHICAFDAAIPGCESGECVITACQPGYTDRDGIVENGCEGDCFPDSSATDHCDGNDNDCDGYTDEDYVPIPCGVGICRSSSYCLDGTIVDCLEGSPTEAEETTCDGLDNNCDGDTDEGITLPCTNDCGTGELICRGGEYPACSGQDELGNVCIDISFFCETIPVRLEIPLPTPEEGLGLDLVFVFDRSGSFSDDLTTFRNKAAELTDGLSLEISNLAVGLASFIDAPCSGFGRSSDFGYEMNLAVTTDLAQLRTALNALDTRDGADAKEAQLEALYQALTGEGVVVTSGGSDCRGTADIPVTNLGWRERALSYVFLSTDNAFHRPTDTNFPYPHGVDAVINKAVENSTSIFFLQAGGTIDPDARPIAAATGGEFFNLSSNSSEIVETVTGAVLDALANTVVELVPEGDDLGFVTDVFPTQLTGVDLLTNTTVDVTVTLLSTVDPTGEVQTYDFDLVFYVNDSEVERRPVTISIPAEDPKDCTNRPPIIRELQLVPSVEIDSRTPITVLVDEPDGNAVNYHWEVTAGTILEPTGRSTIYGAPSVPGLVEFCVTASDWEGRADQATVLMQVLGGQCNVQGAVMDVGLTEGRMVHEGGRGAGAIVGTCGGAGFEEVLVLRVHRSGRYLVTAEPGTGVVLYMRQPDCYSELACAAGPSLEVDLSAGNYYLVVDSESSAAGTYLLYVEPVEP